jgi:hypothetical protein
MRLILRQSQELSYNLRVRYLVTLKVQNAHARSRCRDLNGTEYWACDDCDCTARLEARLRTKGRPFRPVHK